MLCTLADESEPRPTSWACTTRPDVLQRRGVLTLRQALCSRGWDLRGMRPRPGESDLWVAPGLQGRAPTPSCPTTDTRTWRTRKCRLLRGVLTWLVGLPEYLAVHMPVTMQSQQIAQAGKDYSAATQKKPPPVIVTHEAKCGKPPEYSACECQRCVHVKSYHSLPLMHQLHNWWLQLDHSRPSGASPGAAAHLAGGIVYLHYQGDPTSQRNAAFTFN